LPLIRVYESPDPVQYKLLDDTFDRAAGLIDEAIAAADAEDLLPAALPANIARNGVTRNGVRSCTERGHTERGQVLQVAHPIG